jgi:signal transduction histidine kinase
VTDRPAVASRHPDYLAGFAPLVIAVRWGTVAIGLALSAVGTEAPGSLAAGAVLLAYAALRTVRPLRYLGDSLMSLVMVVAEVALNVGVVVATGYWESPYVFCLATAIVAAGFARGFGFAIRTALTAVAAVALPYHLDVPGARSFTSVQWGGELLLIALVAGYARRLFGEAEERNYLAVQANELLSQLHLVAQTLPASLDLDENVRSTVAQVRDHLTVDVVAVLLFEPATATWTVAAADGARLPASLGPDELPPPVRRMISARHPLLATLTGGDRPGLSGVADVGIYAPLEARGHLVGLVAAECRDGERLGERELGVLGEIADQAALAIDNARRFGHLRTVGADEERTRIARDLHDRVGQSLAYLAFELDRISRQAAGQPVEGDLQRLRQDVRKVVTQVRDTLYDLRTDVSENQDLVATLADFLDRVAARTGIEVSFEHDGAGRLPVRQERELWRIAQEAVTNASRHAGASTIRVRWRREDGCPVLEVSDDGAGLPEGAASRLDSYGIQGMRERAGAIGATLEVESAAGRGTTVRCRLVGP